MSFLGPRKRTIFYGRRQLAARKRARRPRVVYYGRPRFRGRFVKGYNRTAGYYGRFRQNGELKFHDVDLDDAVVATGGTVTPSIALIAQGVTESTRVGRKCTIKSIGWKYQYDLPSEQDKADISNGDTLRIILYLDKQANGATATVTGILESADFQSFNNLANSSRFHTMLDRTVVINRMVAMTDGASTSATPFITRSGSFYKSCTIPMEFDSTMGVITEIRSNNIGVLLISQNGLCGFESKFRLRFSDGA